MNSKTLIVLLVLAVASQAKMLHNQDDAALICCLDTYVFDDDSLTCVCPPQTPVKN